MILGGDEPWTRRVIAVSTCPHVGSMFNEGIWNAQTTTWEGSAIPRIMEGDEAHYAAFLLGTPSLQAAGCSTQIFKLPRACVVLCILHLTMAMGRLLGEFVDREARAVTPSLRSRHANSPTGEACRLERLWVSFPGRGRNGQFFEALPDIARCLGIRPSTAKYKAIANMWDLLRALYCTY